MNDKYEIFSVSSEMWQCDQNKFPNLVVLRIQWTANIGWGQIDFSYNTNTHKWSIDNECMSEEFCKAVLDKWLHCIYSGEQEFQTLEDSEIWSQR